MWGPRFRAQGGFEAGKHPSVTFYLFTYGVSRERGKDKFQGIYSKSSYIQNLVRSYPNDRLLARVEIIKSFSVFTPLQLLNRRTKNI